MEVIKSGKFKSIGDAIIFNCSHCGCKFKAHHDEYHKEQASSNVSGLVYTTYTICNYDYYYANCPECYKMCCTTESRLTDAWTCSSTNINLDTSTTTATGDSNV